MCLRCVFFYEDFTCFYHTIKDWSWIVAGFDRAVFSDFVTKNQFKYYKTDTIVVK